jgi:hypothetical protein
METAEQESGTLIHCHLIACSSSMTLVFRAFVSVEHQGRRVNQSFRGSLNLPPLTDLATDQRCETLIY